MVRYRKCAVRGCANEDASRHCFPNPKKDMALFNTWAMACKNSTIYASQPDLVYRSYRVCHIHFKMSDTVGSCRLKKTAVPSLCLPEKMTHFSRGKYKCISEFHLYHFTYAYSLWHLPLAFYYKMFQLDSNHI